MWILWTFINHAADRRGREWTQAGVDAGVDAGRRGRRGMKRCVLMWVCGFVDRVDVVDVF